MPSIHQEKTTSSFDEWQREKEFLEREKEMHPELFERRPSVDDDNILKNVGIENVFGPRPLGHIKLFPEDFIVEEVTKDEVLHTVDDGPIFSEKGGHSSEEARTVWLDLVKMGRDSIEIVDEFSRLLGLEKKFIGIAGIKDKQALTSQAVSLRGVSPEKVAEIRASNFFIKNIAAGKGALNIGDLLGNRFTILVRTPKGLKQEAMEKKLQDLEEQGFWNFFYLQRFGTPRLISHKLGLLILQGKFEEVVRASLTYGPQPVPYFEKFRGSLKEFWGDWRRLLEMIGPLPYSFHEERKMLEYLVEHPKDFSGALNQIPEQIKLWVYAYGSFLFNATLSRLIRSGEDVLFTLPLPLSSDPRTGELYGNFFRKHKVSPPFPALKHFPYVQRMEKDVETLKKFTLNGVRVMEEGVVLDFFLEKASYATTFLSHLFMLSTGQPVPEGISVSEVDSKKILGTGTIEPLKRDKFRELFEMRKETAVEVRPLEQNPG